MNGRGSLRIDDRPTHEIRIIFTKDEFSRVLVHRVVDVKIAKEWCAEETWDVGIVHAIF